MRLSHGEVDGRASSTPTAKATPGRRRCSRRATTPEPSHPSENPSPDLAAFILGRTEGAADGLHPGCKRRVGACEEARLWALTRCAGRAACAFCTRRDRA